MALVSDLLDQLADDPAGVPRRAQDLTRRRWFGRGAPHRGWIPWSAPAHAVLGFVRAFDHGPSASPWGTPRALVSGRGEIGVERLAATGWAAGRPAGEVRTRPGDDGLYVATADEWLQVLRVRVAGRPVAPSDVLAPGITLTAPTPPALKPPGGPGNNTARG